MAKKKKPAKKATKKAAKKRAPAKKMKAKAKRKAKPKAASKSKVKAKAKSKNSNMLSFTELFELKKEKMAEQGQPAIWKDTPPDAGSPINEHAKAPVNVRNGRTNGAGVRHK